MKKTRTKQEVIEACQKLVLYLVDEYFSSFPNFAKSINTLIGQTHTVSVHPLKDPGHWRRIAREDSVVLANSNRTDLDHYLELEAILKTLASQYDKKAGSVTGSLGPSFSPAKNKTIRYGVFPCQDTILPWFFENAYNSEEYNVDFKIYKDWNEGLEAFKNNEIDVALHNFPTVIAHNALYPQRSPLLFWPFFSFNGYGLFVRNSALWDFQDNHWLRRDVFKNMPLAKRQEFFKKNQVLVECGTDFEWVLKNYLKTHLDMTDEEIREVALDNQNTNDAKMIFTATGDPHVFYCTNPIHIHDLLVRKENGGPVYELIAHGDGMTKHKNFNGLICSESFLQTEDNLLIVNDIIRIWFRHTRSFLRRLELFLKQNPLEIYTSNSVLQLVDFLNRETKSNIQEHQLGHVFDKAYNHFYENQDMAFHDFYAERNDTDDFYKNNLAIAKIAIQQFDKNISDDTIKQIIKNTMDGMSEI